MPLYYVSATWEDWPKTGSYADTILADNEDEAKQAIKYRMAESRVHEMPYEKVLETYAHSWHVVDCVEAGDLVASLLQNLRKAAEATDAPEPASLPVQGDTLGKARVMFRGLRYSLNAASLTETLRSAGLIPQASCIERIEGANSDVEIDVWTSRAVASGIVVPEVLTLWLPYEALAEAVSSLVTLPKGERYFLRRVETVGYRPYSLPTGIVFTYQHVADE